MKEKYLVFDNEYTYEFDIFISQIDVGTAFDLHANNTSIWSDHIKGQLLLRMIDTGDQFVFEDITSSKNKRLQLDYNIAEYIKILMGFENQINGKISLSSYKILNENAFTQI